MLVEFGLGMEGCHYIGSIGQHCLNRVGIRLCLVSDVALQAVRICTMSSGWLILLETNKLQS